jgi:hypothetical protein
MDEYIVQLNKKYEEEYKRIKTKNIRKEIAQQNEKEDIICDEETLEELVQERVKNIKVPLMSTTDVGKLIINGTRNAAIKQMNDKLRNAAATFTKELEELQDSSRRMAVKLKELREEEVKDATAKFIYAKRQGLQSTVDFKLLQEQDRARSHKLVMLNKNETQAVRDRALAKLEQSENKQVDLMSHGNMYAIYERATMELSVVIKTIKDNLDRVRNGQVEYKNAYAGSVEYMGLHDYYSNSHNLDKAIALQKELNQKCKGLKRSIYDS